MKNMNGLACALTLLAASAPASAFGGERVAPPVVMHKPAPAPAATPAAGPIASGPTASGVAPAPACGAAGAPPCAGTRVAGSSPDAYYAALAASAGGAGGDPVLDRGLMTTMSRLMAAGRCHDAIDLAARGGRAAVAARAREICGRN